MTNELYALGDDRSPEAVLRFLDHFLPEREVFTDEFPIPAFSDNPTRVFVTDRELIEYLGANMSVPYSVYWNDRTPGSFRQAMAFYTTDGKIIYGLAVLNAGQDDLNELAEFVRAGYARMGDESPPPDVSTDFITQCKTWGRMT